MAWTDREKIDRAVDEGVFVGDLVTLAELLAEEVRRSRVEAVERLMAHNRSMGDTLCDLADWFDREASDNMPCVAGHPDGGSWQTCHHCICSRQADDLRSDAAGVPRRDAVRKAAGIGAGPDAGGAGDAGPPGLTWEIYNR